MTQVHLFELASRICPFHIKNCIITNSHRNPYLPPDFQMQVGFSSLFYCRMWPSNGCNYFLRKLLDMGSLKKVGRPSMTCLEHNAIGGISSVCTTMIDASDSATSSILVNFSLHPETGNGTRLSSMDTGQAFAFSCRRMFNLERHTNNVTVFPRQPLRLQPFVYMPYLETESRDTVTKSPNR